MDPGRCGCPQWGCFESRCDGSIVRWEWWAAMLPCEFSIDILKDLTRYVVKLCWNVSTTPMSPWENKNTDEVKVSDNCIFFYMCEKVVRSLEMFFFADCELTRLVLLIEKILQPVDMIDIMQISHYFKWIFPWFYPSQAVQDFFRQQYDSVSKQGIPQNGQWFPCFILWTWAHITSLKRRTNAFANHTYVPGICTGFIRGVFPKSRMKVHFGLWAKSHLLMSMDHAANEEASTSNDPMNIGRGMERWRMLVSIPSMNFFLPQCGKTQKEPPPQLRCESSSIQREGGFHKVFTREGLETCCLVSCIGNTRCSDKGWSALGHAVKRKRLCFFLVMRLGGDGYILRT